MARFLLRFEVIETTSKIYEAVIDDVDTVEDAMAIFGIDPNFHAEFVYEDVIECTPYELKETEVL